jgi:hypothetical protein
MSDFKTVLVKDSVIGDITSDIDFAVKSGASQCTYQRFPSTSSSNSALIFNVQVPSENVVIGRDVLVSTGLTFTISCTGVPLGTAPFSLGTGVSLQAFPFNELLTTATVQINNTTCSINMKDVLPSIMRMNDSRELYRWNSTTPSLPDQAYGVYSDAVGTGNNPLAGYGNASYDVDQVPRGAFPLQVVRWYINGALQAGVTPVGTATGADVISVVLSTVVTEPIFLSPFIYGNPEYNQQGFLGINNMAFTFNIDATASRLVSASLQSPTYNNYIRTGAGQAIALGDPIAGQSVFTATFPAGSALEAFNTTAPALLFKFLSTQPSDLIQTKNIVPYMDFPRYITASANNPQVASLTKATLTTSNLQINQIPDLLIINVRKPMSAQTIFDPAGFLAITGISINLNNQSGLLSSASTFDLWKMSVRNGSTQSWAEFSGLAQKTVATAVNGVVIPTTGSLLVINPAYDLSLPDYISCGSLGNYNFQAQIGVYNQLATLNPEIVVITVNSGIFSTQQGVSAVYTGILTKEMVLSAKSGGQADAMHSAECARMIGGQMLNAPLSAMRRFGYARRMRPASMSGGVPSGGVQSGGRLKKMC